MGVRLKKKLLSICDRFSLFPLFNLFTRNRAAVFMLHHFGAAGIEDYRSLRADTLERCLRYIVDHGYHALPLSEFVNGLLQRRNLYKSVVFTVDDGYRDFLQHGYPVFAKYRIPVAVFITTGFVDGKFSFWWDNVRRILDQTPLPRIEIKIGDKVISGNSGTVPDKEAILHRIIEQMKYLPASEIPGVLSDLGRSCGIESYQTDNDALSWPQIKDLAGQGVEFYPHTSTHPILSQCPEPVIRKEISEPKETISACLKKPADIFCYPNGRYGDFDHRVIKALRASGYLAAFSSEEGFDRSDGSPDMFKLHRYALFNDVLRFKQIVSGLEAFKTDMARCVKGSKSF